MLGEFGGIQLQKNLVCVICLSAQYSHYPYAVLKRQRRLVEFTSRVLEDVIWDFIDSCALWIIVIYL